MTNWRFEISSTTNFIFKHIPGNACFRNSDDNYGPGFVDQIVYSSSKDSSPAVTRSPQIHNVSDLFTIWTASEDFLN